MTRKILIVATDLDRCEAYTLIGIAKTGFDITVVGVSKLSHKELLLENGIRVIALHFRGRFDPKAIFSLRRLLLNENFVLLHLLSAKAASNALFASLGLPVKRIAYRGTIGHLSRLDPSSWLSFLHPSLDRIICVSRAVERYLAERVAQRKLTTIYKGHDYTWYPRSTARDLSAYDIPVDAFVVTCVANVRPLKGIRFLIEAVDQQPDQYRAHLLLIGRVSSEAQQQFKALARHPERIHFIGFQDVPSLLVSQSDCFVMPSIVREGLSKALLEAMCVRVAPIITAVGGMLEVVQNRENGLVVPAADSAALGGAIKELIEHPKLRQKLADAGFATATTHFTVAESIKKTVAVYNELLLGG